MSGLSQDPGPLTLPFAPGHLGQVEQQADPFQCGHSQQLLLRLTTTAVNQILDQYDLGLF